MMIPVTKTRLRLGDLKTGLTGAVVNRPGDFAANGLVLVVLLLAGVLGGGSWALIGALLTLPVIALARLVTSSALGVRDARDFLAYIDGLGEYFESAEDDDADVIPIRLSVGGEADL
jgi:hypothetical protein